MRNSILPLLTLLLSFSLFSCGQKQLGNRANPDIPSTVTSDPEGTEFDPSAPLIGVAEKLEQGYLKMQPDSFAAVFAEWNKKIGPNKQAMIQRDDTIQAVYEIFKEVYTPLDLLRLGKWEWDNELNANAQYVVVQNRIDFAVMKTENLADFDWQTTKRDSIMDFRPPISLDRKKVLYLTEGYSKTLNAYLGTESTELGEGNIMNPSRPKGESEARYKLLRKYLPILHGHWGGYWHIATHPYIGLIILTNSLDHAKVSIRVGYQGGEALLEKAAGKWKIMESQATWIE